MEVLKQRGGAVLAGDLVDDALHKDDVDVDMAGNIGQKFGDRVADGHGGQADGHARAGGFDVGLEAGHIEVGDFGVYGKADEVGVVEDGRPSSLCVTAVWMMTWPMRVSRWDWGMRW